MTGGRRYDADRAANQRGVADSAGHHGEVRLVVDERDFAGWVEQLADRPRAKRAWWHLVRSGPPALPAVRAGLADADPVVRD